MDVEIKYWKNIHCIDMTDSGGFDIYYKNMEEVIKLSFFDRCQQKYGYSPSLDQTMISLFMNEMRHITIRTLILEMKVCDKCGELKGNTESEKYHSYVKDFLCNPQYLKELYSEYPYMYKLIMQWLDHCISSLMKLMDRFRQDLEELNKIFFVQNPCEKITHIGGGSSDSHNGGQKVFVLELDNSKKLVYKPRNMAIDEAYMNFIQWVCRKMDLVFWWFHVWDRDEYGWAEWVESKSCLSYEQLERYYQRNGVLLCISYLLGSRDLHYENLIACGEYPVIVDLELGIGSGKLNNVEKEREIERIYRDSVLQTGILPLYAWNEAGEGINVGAINGEGGQVIPVSVPVAVQGGSLNMHIEYRRPIMDEGKNLAMLNGEFIQPYEFLDKIVEGFEKCYNFILENKQEVAERLNCFNGIKARYLVRDTQQYSMLLMTSYHPDFMRGEDVRRKILYRIEHNSGNEKDAVKQWITEQEVQELLQGDIPYFWTNVSEKSLYSGTGESIQDFFEAPAIYSVQKRLFQMNLTDLHRQINLINSALLLGLKRNKQVDYIVPSNVDINRVKIAENIGDLLLEEAIWSSDENEVGWISIIMAGYREYNYLIRPMGFYLYDGLAGITVFLTLLESKTENEKYRELSSVLRKQLFSYTDQLYCGQIEEKLPSGAFCGEASVAYAYQLLYSIKRERIYIDYMKKHCEILSILLSGDKNYDVLGGNAGAILVLLNAYKLTKDRQYIIWAKEAANYLMNAAYEYEWGIGWINSYAESALTGFAHGSSGMVLAFTRLGYYTRDYKYYNAAYLAYTFEQHYYDEKRQDWQDLRYSAEQQQDMDSSMAWCHGWGGIIASRMRAVKYSVGKLKWELEDSINLRDWRGDKSMIEKGLCLCHGGFGNAALLSHLDGEWAEKKRDELIGMLDRHSGNIKEVLDMQECANYGMMSGIAGIGVGCLYRTEELLKLLMVEVGE